MQTTHLSRTLLHNRPASHQKTPIRFASANSKISRSFTYISHSTITQTTLFKNNNKALPRNFSLFGGHKKETEKYEPKEFSKGFDQGLKVGVR